MIERILYRYPSSSSFDTLGFVSNKLHLVNIGTPARALLCLILLGKKCWHGPRRCPGACVVEVLQSGGWVHYATIDCLSECTKVLVGFACAVHSLNALCCFLFRK